MLKYILSSTIFLALLVVGCKSKPAEKPITDDIIPVKVVGLQTDSMQQEITASGQFTTDDETILSFKNGGIINRILVKEGDAVRAGQVLATSNATEINTMAEQASLAYQKAQRDYERARNLYRDSVATLEQMQNAKTALDIAKQQTQSAGFNQSYSEIRATRNGFVLKKFANDGQVVGPGTPVLQINGAANGKWILKTGVSDYQWGIIKVGDKANITTDALPGKSFDAVVTKKSEAIDPASGTFTVQLQLNSVPPSTIASGLFGKAVIYPSRSTNGWSIPYDALLDGNANDAYVFVTNDNITAKKVKVQVSSIQHERVMISAGLEGVKSVIVSGNAYLNDGSKIRVQ